MAGYVIQTDGSSRRNPGPAGIGVAVIDPAGNTIKEISRAIGVRTCNQAEYEALARALEEAGKLTPPVVVQLDSELLYYQLSGKYRVRNEELKPLYERCRLLLDNAPGVTLKLVSRKENKIADKLAWTASGGK
ncbi:MAG TPA: ribonuclease HI family protein [candidate division WOR-3 bacterium]|uniref:Ribonuclease HI family protein n=1 Tax=candidate division WOR-3 bacterium TaxID=2052148 RepID=A0A7V0T709_UNCW3|nr:ribonuclease HI family protein [candidate division WOR-3 bacterium]